MATRGGWSATKYLCPHPGHTNEVDLSAEVWLERGAYGSAGELVVLLTVAEAARRIVSECEAGPYNAQRIADAIVGPYAPASPAWVALLGEEGQEGEVPEGLFAWGDVRDKVASMTANDRCQPSAVPIFRYSPENVHLLVAPSRAELEDADFNDDDYVLVVPSPSSPVPGGVYLLEDLAQQLAGIGVQLDVQAVTNALAQIETARLDKRVPRLRPELESAHRIKGSSLEDTRSGMWVAALVTVLAGLVVAGLKRELVALALLGLAAAVLGAAVFSTRAVQWLRDLLGAYDETPHGAWRVIVPCPVNEQTAPEHNVVFTGTGDPEPDVVRGVYATGRDVELETVAKEYLSPKESIERLNKQIPTILAGGALFTAVLGGFGWQSNALGTLVREASFEFCVAIVAMSVSLGVGVSAYVAGSSGRGNLNNLEEVRRIINRTIGMRRARVQLATWLWTFAVVFAVVPAVVIARDDRFVSGPATVSITSADGVHTATSKATVSGLRRNEVAGLRVTGIPGGAVLVDHRAGPDSDGNVAFDVPVSLRATDHELIGVAVGRSDALPACAAVETAAAGCSITALPNTSEGTPAFGLKLSDTGLDGTVTVNGLAAGTKVHLQATGYSDTGEAMSLLRNVSGAGENGVAALTVALPVPRDRYRIVIVGVAVGSEPTCVLGEPASGCYEVAVPSPPPE